MATDDGANGYGLRKRRRVQQPSNDAEAGLQQLLEVAGTAERIVVFSGSGLSASSGMSTFSTRGGLYERAQRKYKLSDGKMLFTYAFFDRQRPEAQAFFADIYGEAVAAEPAAGHHALRLLHDAGRLQRHYTLNIDGLAEEVGMDTWHHEHNLTGVTVEMHGNVRHLVCPACHATRPVTAPLAQQIQRKAAVPCEAPGCGHGAMRFKVMMYDDGEAECITPDDVMELMEADVKAADLVLWVGISFQQSASTVYFRKVRCWIQEAGRLDSTVQALVNPSDEALFNLRTAMSNQSELRVLEVLAEADEALPLLADRLRRGGGGGARGTPQQPRQQAAALAAAQQQQQRRQSPAMQQPAVVKQEAALPAAQPAALPAAALQAQLVQQLLLQQAAAQAQASAASSLLQQAAGFPGAAALGSWQQPQAAVQALELLQSSLLKAMHLTTAGPMQLAALATAQPAWPQQPALLPQQPAVPPQLLQALAAAHAGAQQQQPPPPPQRPQQQPPLLQQQHQQQQPQPPPQPPPQPLPKPQVQGSPEPPQHAAQEQEPQQPAANGALPPAAGVAPSADAAPAGKPSARQDGSPRAVALEEQSSHDSDQHALLAGTQPEPPAASAATGPPKAEGPAASSDL